MNSLVSATAASAMGAAVLFVALAGLAHLVGASRIAASLARATVVAVLIALGLPMVAAVLAGVVGDPGTPASVGGDPLLCGAVVLGHVVLALFLVARRLDRDSGATRVDDTRRGRVRERAAISVRNDEVEP